jgi:hypothetical protein
MEIQVLITGVVVLALLVLMLGGVLLIQVLAAQ